MKGGIYQIRNTVNGKRYVGSAVNLKKRWQGHQSLLRHRQHYNVHLQNAFDKYGEVTLAFSVLEYVPDSVKLIEREQHFFDTLKPEYNIAPVAGSTLGRHHSEETKRKMSRSQTGKYHTEETKRKLGDASRGRHPSEETRRKMSEAKRGERHPRYGKPCSEEHKRRLSEANKGKNLSPETRARKSQGQKRRWRRFRAAKRRELQERMTHGKKH